MAAHTQTQNIPQSFLVAEKQSRISRLKTQIGQVFIFLSLMVPIIALSFFSYSHAKEYLTNDTFALRQSVTSLAASNVAEKLSMQADIGKNLIENDQFRISVQQGKWKEVQTQLFDMSRQNEFVDDIFIASSSGAVVVTGTGSLPQGENVLSENWYQEVIGGKSLSILASSTHQGYVVAAMPLMLDDKLVGILGVRSPVSVLFNSLTQITVGNSGRVILVDTKGQNILMSGMNAPKPVVQNVLNGKTGVEIVDEAGSEETVQAFRPIQPYGWGIIASEPATTAFAYRDQALQSMIVVYGFVFIVYAGSAYFILSSRRRLAFEKAKLQEANSKDEAILSGIGDGVFVVNREKKIVLINNAARELSGYSNEEALGKLYKEIFKFILEETGEEDESLITTAFHGQKASMQTHTILLTKNGKRLPVGVSAAPVVDGKANVLGVVVVFHDVIKERELEKLKDEFVSVASHELRTPMTAIQGLVSMIKEGDYGEVNKGLQEPLDDILSSTKRLIYLVNDLLNVSRIEAGRVRFDLSTFPLTDAINEVVNLLQPIAKDKGVVLSAEHVEQVTVHSDSNKVKQIINNLVGNSMKFTDTGSITVSSKQTGDLITIYVTDTGMGIGQEDQEKLFNKFQQVSSQQVGRPPGTGLGLYISRQLARKMGGDLWIEKSELGKGSTFAFSIAKADTALAKKVKERIEQDAAEHPDQRPLT